VPVTESWEEGILVVDKPTGPTSHDVVAMARRALGLRRIGHCGTLDPLASGVLVLCVGGYTRLCDWIGQGDKEYEATIRLGATSDTDDVQGQVEAVSGDLPSAARIDAAMAAFRGVIEQVPPAHSAVKVDGVRSYRRARRQEEVVLAPRRVRVDRFDLVELTGSDLRVRVECGRGTYIRSLARDLGQALGCGGYIEALRRTRVGGLRADEAIDLEALRGGSRSALASYRVEPRRALAGVVEEVEVDETAARAFCHGQAVTVTGLTAGPERAVYCDGELLGLGRIDEGQMRPAKVFARREVLAGGGLV
jgi:tRNA pseudouridine55 synthase